MIACCPFCRQSYEIDQDLVGQNVNCSNCGRDFIVTPVLKIAEGHGEERREFSGKKKWKLISLIVGIVLAVSAVSAAAYMFLNSRRAAGREEKNTSKEKNAVDEFKKQYSDYVREAVGDSHSVELDWKAACVNPDRNMFLGICRFRDGKKNGMSEPSHLLKVFGKSDGGKYKFHFAEIHVDASVYQNADWKKFYELERKFRDDFYAAKLYKVSQLAEQTKHELNGVFVPDVDAGNRGLEETESELLKALETLEGMVRSVKTKCDAMRLGRGEDFDEQERYFYSRLFVDGDAKETELNRKLDDILAMAEDKRAKLKSAEKSLSEKILHIRMLSGLAVSYMVDEAITDYKKRHNGALPSKYSVEKYEEHVGRYLGEIVDAYGSIAGDRQNISKFGEPTSDRDRIELQELEKLLQLHRREFRKTYDELLKGIYCDSASQEEFSYGRDKCPSCADFRFPPEHIKLDFRLPDVRELKNYFSSHDRRHSRYRGDSNGMEKLTADEVNAYLSKHPEVKKQLVFGVPDWFELPDGTRTRKNGNEKSGAAGDNAAHGKGKAPEAKRLCVLDILNANRDKITWKPRFGRSVSCGYCNGMGETSILVPNPNYNPKLNSSSPDTRVIRTCRYCRGAKKVTVYPRYKKALIPAEVLKTIRENLSYDAGTFCDFAIGADFKKEIAGKKFYNARTLRLVVPTSAGEEFYFMGNHRHENVAVTVLTQQFGILTQVRIFTSDKELVDSFEKQRHELPVFVRNVQSVHKLPFSKQGRLIFDPNGGGEASGRDADDVVRGGGDDYGSADDADSRKKDGCQVFVIYAVHPDVLSAFYPQLGTPSFPCRWLWRPDESGRR